MANRYDDDRENSEAVLKLNGGMVMPESSVQYVRQTDIDSIRYPELVIKLAETQEGIVTKQEVVELLKVTPVQAYAIIKRLQQEGKLELVYGGKYAKYRLVGENDFNSI